MIKRISIIALVLLLVGIIGSIFTINTQLNQGEVEDEKIITSSDFNNIELYSDNTKITLSSTDDANAKIELIGNYSLHEMTADVEKDTLKVNVKTKNKLFSLDFFLGSLSLTVYVPKKIYENIQVKSNNGRLNVAELEGNTIQAETDNGR